MSLTIHNNIIDKLDYFITNNKIPHIIFYGPSGSGKREILNPPYPYNIKGVS